MNGVPGLWIRGRTSQYRVRVPVQIQSVIGRREVNRSLRTTDYRRAVTQARHTSSEIQRLFDEAEARIVVEGSIALVANGSDWQGVSASKTENAPVIINTPLSEMGLDQLAVRVVARIEAIAPGEQERGDPTTLISVGQVFDEFMNDPGATRTPKTVLAYQSVQRMLLKFIDPNAPITDVDRLTCRRVLNLLPELPANASKHFPGSPCPWFHPGPPGEI